MTTTAEWYADCLSLNDEYDLSALQDPALLSLETRIVEHLTNSWCTEQKARLLLEVVVLTTPAVCVEIGAFTGSCTLPMAAGLSYLQHGHAHIIDAWSNAEAVRGLPPDDVNTVWWSGLDMAAVKGQFTQMLHDWQLTHVCDVLPEPSRDAVSKVPSIDFLHLDGNFSEQGARLDSELYLPKVTTGGYALLSNALVTVASLPTKMKALRPFFESCEIIAELDGGNTLLFRKR